jgi:hypothetical protein
MTHTVHLACLLAVLAAPAALAQGALRTGEEQVVNYAFATQLGSGIYDLSGRTLQIYRLPFGYTFTTPADRRPGVELTLPVTIGLVDFEPRDVLDTGLPENLDTLSFVPGVELDFQLGADWHVLPFGEIGKSVERDGDADATVYSLGVHAARTWRGDWIDLRFDVGATYTAVEPDNSPLEPDDLLLVEIGVEGRHALNLAVAGHPLDWGLYILGQGFLNQPEEPLDATRAEASPYQLEVGVTLGTRAEWVIWHIPVPRLGLGYRFGEDLEVWRIVFGAPF